MKQYKISHKQNMIKCEQPFDKHEKGWLQYQLHWASRENQSLTSCGIAYTLQVLPQCNFLLYWAAFSCPLVAESKQLHLGSNEFILFQKNITINITIKYHSTHVGWLDECELITVNWGHIMIEVMQEKPKSLFQTLQFFFDKWMD